MDLYLCLFICLFPGLCLFPSLLGLFSFDVDFFWISPLSLVNFGVDWHIGNIYVVSVEQSIIFGDDDDEECGL